MTRIIFHAEKRSKENQGRKSAFVDPLPGVEVEFLSEYSDSRAMLDKLIWHLSLK